MKPTTHLSTEALAKESNQQPTTVPQHIAIIMDGNRRWARQKGKHVLAGHQYVADHLLEQLIEHASDVGIKYVTLWAWSTENWQRSQEEVTGVMHLMRHVVRSNIERLHKKGVKIQTIGDVAAFPKDIVGDIQKGIEKTKNNTKITVVFALNYGGRDEIIRAINTVISNQQLAISEKVTQPNTSLSPSYSSSGAKAESRSFLSKEEFSHILDTSEIPDPELIIRTGGEKRLSGFLLWQSEYAELYFTEVLMPDFSPEELDVALDDFAKRKRRFGK